MTRVSCKSIQRVVETGNITVETYGSLHRQAPEYVNLDFLPTATISEDGAILTAPLCLTVPVPPDAM